MQLNESIIDAFEGDAELARDVVEELTRGHNFELYKTHERQRDVAKLNQLEHGATPIGQLSMRIDAEAYHYWGQRLGYGCWKDEAFLREFQRDNPAVKVSYRKKPMVMVDGFREEVVTHNDSHTTKDRRAVTMTDEEKAARWQAPAQKEAAAL